MYKVGIVGAGAIGRRIVKAIVDGVVDAKIVGMFDKTPSKVQSVLSSFGVFGCGLLSIEDMAEKADIVVECASQEAVRMYGQTILERGCNLMVMSVGALLDDALLTKLINIAKEKGCKIYVPSGAVVGIDGLKASSIGRVYNVVLTSSKPLNSIINAPFFDTYKEKIKERKKVFEGSPTQAVKLFPASVNVSATINLLFGKCVVNVIADPDASKITHTLEVEGDFGRFVATTENIPSKDNPRTSEIAALSAIAMLKRITSPIEIGT